MGGEKCVARALISAISGSPPRGRGKVFGPFRFAALTRITPAWAGKSMVGPALWSGCCGSPPRGRGKGPAVVYLSCKERITPAWAGKSSIHTTRICTCWDHPRVGGEKPGGPGYAYNDWGSPPRGRGKEHLPSIPVLPIGITPAWAGKSK